MSAAEVLDVARAAGIRIGIDGNDLVLEALAPPSWDVLDLLSHHKADIVTLLRSGDGWSAEDWQVFFDEQAGITEFDSGLLRTQAEARAFECCVVEWLNRNPAPSPAGQCAWCGYPETEDAVVLPYGAEPWGHTWLHAECWDAWREARRAHAEKALALMGVSPPSIDCSPAPSSYRRRHAGRDAANGDSYE